MIDPLWIITPVLAFFIATVMFIAHDYHSRPRRKKKRSREHKKRSREHKKRRRRDQSIRLDDVKLELIDRVSDTIEYSQSVQPEKFYRALQTSRASAKSSLHVPPLSLSLSTRASNPLSFGTSPWSAWTQRTLRMLEQADKGTSTADLFDPVVEGSVKRPQNWVIDIDDSQFLEFSHSVVLCDPESKSVTGEAGGSGDLEEKKDAPKCFLYTPPAR